MSAPLFPTAAELLAFLREQGLLTPSQSMEVGADERSPFAEAQPLVLELVERNWLTPFQASLLLQGRGSELLLGPYRLLDQLGEGGMGQVFKALHLGMDRVVALKVISKDRVSNPVAVARFYREVRAVAKLSHPNIVTAFDVSQAGETHFLAMEYVDGIDLARLVEQFGPLPLRRACDYARQAALGLQHAHEKGLVHRDVKPGNLMVARPSPDEPPMVKVLDFGLARFESESGPATRLTQLGNIVGTVDYIAPEQEQDPRTADIRADIYGLGCTLYFLLTGRPPFSGRSLSELRPRHQAQPATPLAVVRADVPGELATLVARMLAASREDRPQSPGEVARALARFCRPGGRRVNPAIPTASVPPPAPPRKVDRGRPPHQAERPRPGRLSAARKLLLAVTLPVVLLAVLAGLWAGGVFSGPSPDRESTDLSALPPTGGNMLTEQRAKGKAPAPLKASERKDVPPRPTTSERKDVPPRPTTSERKSGPTPGQVKAPPQQVVNSVGIKLALIPKGKFLMGSPLGERGRHMGDSPGEHSRQMDEHQHEVEITEPFYLGVYEVTQGQFRRVMGYNPSCFSKDGTGKHGVKYSAEWRPAAGKDKVKGLSNWP